MIGVAVDFSRAMMTRSTMEASENADLLGAISEQSQAVLEPYDNEHGQRHPGWRDGSVAAFTKQRSTQDELNRLSAPAARK